MLYICPQLPSNYILKQVFIRKPFSKEMLIKEIHVLGVPGTDRGEETKQGGIFSEKVS